jgi:hypothetical protein
VAGKTSAPTMVMQGIEVPTSSVNPQEFFRLTRRQRINQQAPRQFAGLGSTDNVQILQQSIISGLMIRFSGTLTVTPGTGTVASTGRWPYDLIKAAKFSANGQSNLINVSGSKLKAREIMQHGDLTDRGISQTIGGATVTQGTMALASEAWGVGSNTTALAAGSPGVELEWYVPVAYDDATLTGAIFAQTSATDLLLSIDWEQVSNLFVLTGNATVSLTGTLTVMSRSYTIPQAPNGQVIVPDLSTFHSMIQSRATQLSNGINEVRLAGQGVGKQLLRLFWQTWNGTAPLPVTDANFGQLAWRFGGNDTPETYSNGRLMRYDVEKTFSSDLAGPNGFKVFDFVNENAFRDTVDEGTATELRFLEEIAGGVALNNAAIEYVAETASIGSAA